MGSSPRKLRLLACNLNVFLIVGLLLCNPLLGVAQDRGNPEGEWRYQSGDAWGGRYSPLVQIDGDNFEKLEIAWIWRTDNFGPSVNYLSRATPSYIDGKLYTVAGSRRTVAAIDPATGETLWTYREPNTGRWERSMRASYGKGVGYGQVDGKGVIYVITPAFFLHALEAKTGQHLKNWGKSVAIDGFPETGVVDLLEDLGHPYDPDYGIPREVGYITSSSPPIVVDGVVIVGNSAEQGYYQTRTENVPGDILGYSARTGEYLWQFNVIPQSEREFGFNTWENDAWKTTGDVSSWAPLSADLERGIVYIPTNPATLDYYGGFRPGDNLFGTSLIALDVKTGERLWHFQTVHHDIWNYDNPNVPILVDITVDGEQIPAVIQTTKQGLTFTFNRETGEPVWPIEERPVPQSEVPGERTAPTQPFPTKPAPVQRLGLTEDDLIDFTPELRQDAIEFLKDFRIGGPYMPPLHVGHSADVTAAVACSGGANITHPTSLDQVTGIMYMASHPVCWAPLVVPGEDRDDPDDPSTTGVTIADWVVRRGAGSRLYGPQGLPIHKPPYSRVTAIDMNTGEHLWWIPIGQPSDGFKNHPALKSVDLSNVGGNSPPITMVTGSLLLATEGSGGRPVLNALDKSTGESKGSVGLPAPGQYGMMTYLHEGRQFIVVQIGASGSYPASLVALTLPE